MWGLAALAGANYVELDARGGPIGEMGVEHDDAGRGIDLDDDRHVRAGDSTPLRAPVDCARIIASNWAPSRNTVVEMLR